MRTSPGWTYPSLSNSSRHKISQSGHLLTKPNSLARRAHAFCPGSRPRSLGQRKALRPPCFPGYHSITLTAISAPVARIVGFSENNAGLVDILKQGGSALRVHSHLQHTIDKTQKQKKSKTCPGIEAPHLEARSGLIWKPHQPWSRPSPNNECSHKQQFSG